MDYSETDLMKVVTAENATSAITKNMLVLPYDYDEYGIRETTSFLIDNLVETSGSTIAILSYGFEESATMLETDNPEYPEYLAGVVAVYSELFSIEVMEEIKIRNRSFINF